MQGQEESNLLTLYSDVRATSVRWLWYPYIAIGKITLLQGDPGDGKSTMMMSLISPIVVDSKGVFVTDAPNGFENVRSILTEYVHRAEKKQQDMTEHEKCLTNGTHERARESGTEQNYDMIDGCVNNMPKKPRRIGGRWSVLDRLHIKQAQRKQKDQTQQQQQERSRKN